MKQKIKDFSYAILANGITTLVNLITTLVLPKVLEVEDYGYYQLYMFYAGYVGVLHMGWADGIYLRYCGTRYEKYNRSLFKGQIILFTGLQIIWFFIAFLFAFQQVIIDKKIVFMSIGILIVIANVKTLFSFILQASNRIQEYAGASIIGNMVSLILYFGLLLKGKQYYALYIYISILGVLITLILYIYYCRQLICCAIRQKRNIFILKQKQETLNNIMVGSKLMIASLASMMVLGVIRWAVEVQWDIEVFAKVSLTLSVSNLFMTFINAIAIVLLPMLRQMDEKKAVCFYKKLDVWLIVVLTGVMLLYYPAYLLISYWLPQYQQSLRYMAILFPICIFEGKISMLLNTYLKLFRQEKSILYINISAVVISIIFSVVSVFILQDLTLTIGMIVVVLAIRCIISEVCLSRYLHVRICKSLAIEIGASVCFIWSSWKIGGSKGVISYLCGFIVILILNMQELKDTICSLRIRINEK